VVYVKIEDVLEAGREMSKFIEKINKVLNDPSIENTLGELELYVHALDDLLNKRARKFHVSVNEHGCALVYHEYIPDILLYYTPLYQDAKASDLANELLNDEEFKKTLAERILSAMALLSRMLTTSIEKMLDQSL
jgi:hypothetical protein